MTTTTFVVVPGAWQKSVFFEDFCAKLRNAGYPTELVALPTVGGTETPLASLADDVAAVQAVLKNVTGNGNGVVVVGHSSGGVVASNAVEGFDVAGVVYLTAFMVPKGKSLLELLGGQPLPWMDVQGDRVLGVPDLLPQIAFNDLNPEAQAEWSKEMTHTSAALFATPSGFEPWANGLRCGYIFCLKDNALPLAVQQQMAAQLGPNPVTATLTSGHCPHLSIPDELTETVIAISNRLS